MTTTNETILSATDSPGTAEEVYVQPTDPTCEHPDGCVLGEGYSSEDADGDGIPEVHTLLYTSYRCPACGAEWVVQA